MSRSHYDDGSQVRPSEENDDFAWIDVAEIPDRDYARMIGEQLDAYVAYAGKEAARQGV